jgi:hypothetical protein
MALISSGYVTPLAWAVTDVFTVIGQNAYMAPCMSFAGEFVLRLSCSDHSSSNSDHSIESTLSAARCSKNVVFIHHIGTKR